MEHWRIIYGLSGIINFTQLDLKRINLQLTKSECLELRKFVVVPSLLKFSLFYDGTERTLWNSNRAQNKQKPGIGVSNSQIMLDVKWMLQFFAFTHDSLCCHLVDNKFFCQKHFLPINNSLKCLRTDKPYFVPQKSNYEQRTCALEQCGLKALNKIPLESYTCLTSIQRLNMRDINTRIKFSGVEIYHFSC